MVSYDYWVDTYPIDPPVGGNAWGAKANVKQIGTGRTDDVFTLREHWGQTKDQARSKADAEAKEWIASHSGGGS
jgi:hypothetical protein